VQRADRQITGGEAGSCLLLKGGKSKVAKTPEDDWNVERKEGIEPAPIGESPQGLHEGGERAGPTQKEKNLALFYQGLRHEQAGKSTTGRKAGKKGCGKRSYKIMLAPSRKGSVMA